MSQLHVHIGDRRKLTDIGGICWSGGVIGTRADGWRIVGDWIKG